MQIHSWSFVLQIASFCPFGTVTTSTTYRCDSLLMIIFECYVCVGCNCMFLLTLGPKGRIVNIFLFQFYLWLTNVPMTFLGIEISWVFIYLFFFFSRLCSGRILGLMVVVVILINTGKITRCCDQLCLVIRSLNQSMVFLSLQFIYLFFQSHYIEFWKLNLWIIVFCWYK